MIRDVRHIAVCTALLVAIAPGLGRAQGLGEDPFAAALLGEWTGSGVYQGAELSLTRSWTLELGGRFLRADMRVSMANGVSFGGLTYWRSAGDGGYEIAWMDGTGRLQLLEAERDSETGAVFSDFVDDRAEGGPEERRWAFELHGEDGYSERLFRRSGDGWELLTEWVFGRSSEADG